MNKFNKEKWYDKEIAPTLLELAAKCKEHGVPFLAVVEYKSGECGRTNSIPDHTGLAMALLYMCAQAGTNLDSFFIAVVRYCREHSVPTDQSFVMRTLTNAPAK